MRYWGPTPLGQHFAQCVQTRHVDSRYCRAFRRSATSSPIPFSGISARNSAIMGFITAQLQIFRPSASGARRTKALDSTSKCTRHLQTPAASMQRKVPRGKCPALARLKKCRFYRHFTHSAPAPSPCRGDSHGRSYISLRAHGSTGHSAQFLFAGRACKTRLGFPQASNHAFNEKPRGVR